MDLIPQGPVPAASIQWRLRSGEWVQTVVCRLTFQLRPHTSTLAEVQDPVIQIDAHWDDDPSRSLRTPTDLVPFKARAEVLLVGSAFSPRGEPVRSLVARLQSGEIDKSIEVFCDRAWTKEGQIREGPPFVRMPLWYECAGGGPDTENPVGMRADARPDHHGAVPIPNLQPPGLSPERPGDPIRPLGFGPVSPLWPERRGRLGPNAGDWPAAGWTERALPEGIHPRFFNAAPPDQELDELHADQQILLENLHPSHPRLLTTLPGLVPVVTVARPGLPPEIVDMRPDTLWIDTNRQVCAMVWRAQIQLALRDEPGRITVQMEPSSPRPFAAKAPSQRPPRKEDDPRAAAVRTAGPVAQPRRPILPFVAGGLLMTQELPPRHSAAALAADLRPVVDAPPAAALRAPGIVRLPLYALAEGGGVLGASNAAAQADAWPPSRPEPAPEPPIADAPRIELPAEERPREIIKLLWIDPQCLRAVRRHPEWRRIIAELDLDPEGDASDEPASDEDPRDALDRRHVIQVMTRGTAISGDRLARAFDLAIDKNGCFEPKIALLAGEIEFPFDELSTLKATMAAALPFAGGDKKLKEALDTVSELLNTPWVHGSRSIAVRMTERIRDAFASTRRGLPSDYLESHTERQLLEERRYQRRTVYGQPRIRSLLHLPGAASPTPAYLPESLANELPLFRRLKTRMLGTIDLREDQDETSPIAVRAAALSRVVGPR